MCVRERERGIWSCVYRETLSSELKSITVMLIHLSLSLLCVLLLPNTLTHGLTPEPVVFPHLVRCRSQELETFRCWWSSGSLSNFSEPGSLTVFYQMTKKHPGEWLQCPEYTASVQNECYFNKSFTHIWTSYCVELRSTSNNITFDRHCFTVENIVFPDPPVALNWTLLNVSRSGLNYDVMIRWAPPLSADVQSGWIVLKYEVQYRVQNSTHWDKLDLEGGTHKPLYGLNTDRLYEVRVRSTTSSAQNFGEFSNSIFIKISQPDSDSSFPLRLVVIVGALMLLVLLILVLLSQQHRLMVILLPPVPAPKIKGIDPEILKNGKLEQLNSLLSSQCMYNPDLYPDHAWVEFIHIDQHEAKDKRHASDTQRLLGPARYIGSVHKCDDDSGLEVDSNREECHPLVTRSNFTSAPDVPVTTEAHSGTENWMNMNFYAQVSEVTPAGGVVLAPEQHVDTAMEKKSKEQVVKELDLQLVEMVEPGSNQNPSQMYHMIPEEQRAEPAFLPLSDYTVVQEVDEHHSVLLNSPPTLPSLHPHNPSKSPPAVPMGYLTPELLHNFGS